MNMHKDEIKDAIKAILRNPQDLDAQEHLVQLINSATIAEAIAEAAEELKGQDDANGTIMAS